MGGTSTEREVGTSTGGVAASTTSSRWRRLDPYWVVGAVLVVLLIVQTLNQRWSTDFWLHKAALDNLRNHLSHPIHPLAGTDADFEYYSPYAFGLALIGRTTGWSSIVILQLGAIFNLTLFLVGFRLFVGALTNRLAVTFALLATLLFWGWHPWRWSGYLNLNSIGFGLPYPSMFATGLALVVAWALMRYARTRNVWWLAFIAAGLPLVMLSHPITGLWTCVALLALGIHLQLYRRPTLLPLLVVVAVDVGALLLWPYFPFFRLITATNHVGTPELYSNVPIRLCAATVGVVPIWLRWRKDRTDPLALMFIAGAALFTFGWIRADYNLGRVLPLALLPLHIGIGELIAALVYRTSPFERTAARQRWLVGWVAVSAIVGFVGVASALASMVPRALLPGSIRARAELQPLTAPYKSLGHTLPAGSVVVVESDYMEGLVASYGLRPLTVEQARAFVPDANQRRSASQAILNAHTSAARREALLAKYHVAGVMCATRACADLFSGPHVRFDGTTVVELKG